MKKMIYAVKHNHRTGHRHLEVARTAAGFESILEFEHNPKVSCFVHKVSNEEAAAEFGDHGIAYAIKRMKSLERNGWPV